MKPSTRLFAFVLLVAASVADRAAATIDIFDPQPEGRTSGIAMQGATLVDSDLASLIRDTIVDEEGDSRVKNATFLFQQCFGGGFLDDVNDALEFVPGMSFVAGSAARDDEVGFGLKSHREIIAEGGTPPPGFPVLSETHWTQSLLPALGNPTISVHDAVGAAILNDPFGTFGPAPLTENGQRITVNGDTFKLRDPDAQSFHAVLIAGAVDRDGFRADVEGMFDTLVDAWGDPVTNMNVSISVLFGNGTTDAAGNALPPEWNAQAATIQNLEMTLEAIEGKLNPNEQFLMYVTDHGISNGKITNAPPGLLPAGVRRNDQYDLSASELLGYQRDPANENPQVSVYFEHSGTPGAGETVELLFNDVSIGSMVPQSGLNAFMAVVPEDLLELDNTVSIENATLQPIDIQDSSFLGAALSTIPLNPNGRGGGTLLETSKWTGLGDGISHNDSNNWDGGVPDGDDSAAKYKDFPDGLNVSINGNVTTRVKVVNSDVTLQQVNGGSLTLPPSMRPDDLSRDPQIKLRDSHLTTDVVVALADDSLVKFRGLSGMAHFMRPIRTNDKELYFFAKRETFATVTFDSDFEGGMNGGGLHAEKTMFNVQDSLTAARVRLMEGGVNLTGMNSQLRTTELELKHASLSVGMSLDPLPGLTQAISLQGSALSRFAEGLAEVTQGVYLGDGASTISGSAFGGMGGIQFHGLLTRHNGGVIGFNTFGTEYPFIFDNVQGAAPNSPIFYATFNNDSTFADFDSASGEIGPFDDYVDLATVGPDTVAGLPGSTTPYMMTADTSAYAMRLGPSPFVTALDGGGNTLTTNSMLVTNTSGAELNNLIIQPPDREGDGPNEFVTIGAANTQLTISGVDIQDNTAPTDWTIAKARVVVNDSLTKTGVTRLVGSSSVTLNGATAGVGGTQIHIDGMALLRLIDNSLAQHVTLSPNSMGATIDADGHSRLDGNVSIEINTAGDRPVAFGSLNPNDSLTIAGTFQRTGAGNGAAGQGRAVVNLGSQFTSGPIIIEPTANLLDFGLRINVSTPQLVNDGKLGQTEVFDNVQLSGNGSYLELEFSGNDTTLAPGASIGTTQVTGDLVWGGTNNTYAAEITDDGQSDMLIVGGTLDLAGDSDVLDVSFLTGNTLGAATYTLATYSTLAGVFDTVIFDGNPIADPMMAGAFQGTHQLSYGTNALLLTSEAVGLAGDYNNNGIVDAADYTVWRDTLGTNFDLNGNGDETGGSAGIVDEADYDLWAAHFGETAGSGAANLAPAGSPEANDAVPEPGMLSLLGLTGLMLLARRWPRSEAVYKR